MFGRADTNPSRADQGIKADQTASTHSDKLNPTALDLYFCDGFIWWGLDLEFLLMKLST